MSSFEVAAERIAELRNAISVISRTGYCEAAICSRLGLDDITQLNWRNLPHYRAVRLKARDPLDLAIDLFLLQGRNSDAEIQRLLPAESIAALRHVGFLEKGNRAAISLYPVNDKLIVSDLAWPELRGIEVPYNQVMAVGSDSRQLLHATVRRHFKSALDLCTGSGVQALLSARHAERVVAVDINPRAAQCARLNAMLMELDNVQVLESDLYSSAEQFDLITANPPFVPSPVQTLGFRDGGPSGEDVQRRIVGLLPKLLAENGIAQIVTELGEREGESITCRIREWLNGAPMDIIVLRLAEYPVQQYAVGHARGDEYQTFLQSVGEWEANLRVQGYVRVVAVLISFEWTNPHCGGSWERIYKCPPPRQYAGDEIAEMFHAERLPRHPGFEHLSRACQLQWAGPIACMDSKVLGNGAPARSTATVLGKALAIEHDLTAEERLFLDELKGEPETLRSLIRKRLLRFVMQKPAS